jgi:hypothetical protein
MGSLSKSQSFPRKRESSPLTTPSRRFEEWIRAFAGMSATCSAHVAQMTSVSGKGFLEGRGNWDDIIKVTIQK